ncbi:MAG TPA: hypothetical protein VKU41_04865, partial [Polyangiaceae bacterium]|nr:hypothetical protein [Polyangiaceae bacterium]
MRGAWWLLVVVGACGGPAFAPAAQDLGATDAGIDSPEDVATAPLDASTTADAPAEVAPVQEAAPVIVDAGDDGFADACAA